MSGHKIAVNGTVLGATTLALLLQVSDVDGDAGSAGTKIWIPRSEIEDDDGCGVGQEVDIEVSQWLLEEKGVF
jgi:hypothetical protein